MKPILEHQDGVTILVVPSKSLSAGAVNSFKHEAEQLLSGGKIIIDLSAVHYLDSAGCAALLNLHRKARETGGDLRICGVSAPVRALFEQLRVQRVLVLHASREEALKALRG